MLFLTLIAAVAAAILSASLVAAIRPWLARYALARPNARSSHRVPTPQGAGIAVIAATLITAAAIFFLVAAPMDVALVTSVFVATLLIAFVGAVDDLRPIPVFPRLALQTLCVGLVLGTAGPDIRVVADAPLWLERAILLLAGLWFVNLVNFMDGIDWMSVAEVVPITATLVALGALGHVSPPAILVAAALGGAMLGFAPFNRPTAKVFLGDVGSLPIGLLLAWCLFDLAAHGQLIAAIILPMYYLADATVTLALRLRRREPFWMAHRSHFYQRATDGGASVLRVVGDVFTVNCMLAVLALLSVATNSVSAAMVSLLTAVAVVASLLVRFSRARRRPD